MTKRRVNNEELRCQRMLTERLIPVTLDIILVKFVNKVESSEQFKKITKSNIVTEI